MRSWSTHWSIFHSIFPFFSIFFTDAFVLKSRGWSRWVIFLSTTTWTIFKRSSSLVTLSVDWALNASQSMSAFWSFCNPSSSLTWQKYGSTTLSNRLLSHTRCSSVLDYSLNKIHWGIQQMQVTVFTVQIKWKGNIFPVIVSSKVTVMPRLSFPPFLETCFHPVSAILTFSVGTNFDGVWSMFRISSSDMLHFNTADAISLWSCVLPKMKMLLWVLTMLLPYVETCSVQWL